MATHTTLASLFTAIADAIRAKKGTSATIVADNFPTEIANLPSGSSYTLIASKQVTVNTTSTSATSCTTLALGSSNYRSDKIIYVKVRDKAGKRAGYFYGSDAFFFNYQKANSGTSTLTYAARAIHRYSTSSVWSTYTTSTTTGYGVYGYSITSDGTLNVYQRYNSSYSLTINGTYVIEAFVLNTDDGTSPYA